MVEEYKNKKYNNFGVGIFQQFLIQLKNIKIKNLRYSRMIEEYKNKKFKYTLLNLKDQLVGLMEMKSSGEGSTQPRFWR